MDSVIWFSPSIKKPAELIVKPTRLRLNPSAVDLLGDVIGVDVGYDRATGRILIRKGTSYTVSKFKFERKGNNYAVYGDIGGTGLVRSLQEQGVMPGTKYKIFFEKGIWVGYPNDVPIEPNHKPKSKTKIKSKPEPKKFPASLRLDLLGG